MKKFLNIGVVSIISLLFVFGFVLILSSFNIPGIELKSRTVLTGSMEPILSVGSVVFVYPKKSYSLDDIITYRRTVSLIEEPITHRVVEVTLDEAGKTIYFTKGDANDYPDTLPVATDEIYGRVIFQIPFLGKVLEFVKTPWGLILLIVLPAVLIIFDEVKKVRVELKKVSVKKEEEVFKNKNE